MYVGHFAAGNNFDFMASARSRGEVEEIKYEHRGRRMASMNKDERKIKLIVFDSL